MKKYEKRGIYSTKLQKPTCDNYLIVKCLSKLNMAGVFLVTYLLHWACLIRCNTNIIETSRSKNVSTNLTYLYFQTYFVLY